MTLRIIMAGACPYPVPQGSQVFLRDTALGLRRLGHDVQLAVYGYGMGEDDSGLTIHRTRRIPGARKTAAGPSLAKPLLDAALVMTLRRIARTQPVDAIGAHNYEGLMAALASGIRPVVYHAHNAMMDELPHYFRNSRMARGVGAWLDRTFPKRADAVIAPHARLAAYLVDCGCQASKVTVAPPGAAIEAFPMCNVDNENPPVVYTGNLDPYQNLGLLKEAMMQVRAAMPEAKALVATAQPAMLDWAGVALTNDFASMAAVMARGGIFACPRTSWSGFPIKLLNAMAAGMPVVACAGCAHPITHEENGLIVPDDDAGAFAAALLRLLRDVALRRKLGHQARETVARQYAPERVAAIINSVYSGVIT